MEAERKYEEYKQAEEEYKQAEEERWQLCKEYEDRLKAELQTKRAELAESYCSSRKRLIQELEQEADNVYNYKYSSLSDIITVLKQGRADTLKEAINIIVFKEERDAFLGVTKEECDDWLHCCSWLDCDNYGHCDYCLQYKLDLEDVW